MSITPKYDKLLGLLREADSDNSVTINIDFTTLTPFVFNCPVALQFTEQISEGTDATLSIALNTNMAQYDKLTITPTQPGLIILKGITL